MTAAARETAPALIAQLMAGPRSPVQLMRNLECSRATVNRWLSAFEMAGVIVGEHEPGANPANSPKLWRLNVKTRM